MICAVVAGVAGRLAAAPGPRPPELAGYAMEAKTAPQPGPAVPVDTVLPLTFRQGERIVMAGNALFDREQYSGHLEAGLYQLNGDRDLVIRTLAWSADEPDLQPRPANFASLRQHLVREKADTIFAAFGYNESFAGAAGEGAFRNRLAAWVRETKASSFNGTTGPRLVLVSPTAARAFPGISGTAEVNARLIRYTTIMREVAEVEKAGFVDLMTAPPPEPGGEPLTVNGVHLTDRGYAWLAPYFIRQLTGRDAPPANESLRAAILDRNRQFFRRYRPLNTYYYTGARNVDYGYLDFLPAMRNFDLMVAARDRRIWDLAAGRPVSGQPLDDTNLPPLEAVPESRGANEWLSPADEQRAFRVDPRVEVNLFADETRFPDMANPIQMRWDARGRLWVSCSTAYPHLYPGQEPADKMVILEDTDQDGRADKSFVWASDLHIPLSFELIPGGILVSEQPHLTRILDTDGDGRADRRDIVLSGFGTEDSHHSLHDFVWTPDGDLLFRESIFQHSQVETAYGPVRAQNSAWYQFTPATQRLETFGSYDNTNPWGVTFDDWGRHVASHPVLAEAFHAPNPAYPGQHPRPPASIQAYSGTCGHEFVDSPAWPDEWQSCFIKARYKPTNKIEIHRWIGKDGYCEEQFVSDLIFSENLSFIPVDLHFGPRGDLYICDWYNPVKGHAQYSLRDPRRDRSSGRIWRVVPKGAVLPSRPEIAGAALPDLLELLRRPEYACRYLTKRELRERKPEAVAAALDAWLRGLDRKDPRFRHHQTEALWVYRGIGVPRPALLLELLACEEPLARAAAVQMLRHWHALCDGGIDALKRAAADPSAFVRLEAVISAAWFGTRPALDAVLPILTSPMNDHLRYACVCALGCEAVTRLREEDKALATTVDPFLKASAPRKPVKVERKARTPAEAAFDRQKNIAQVEITAVRERLLFSPATFTVKAGQPVKLTVLNPDLMQHNLLIVKPGSLEEVGMAGNDMAKSPDGLKAGFIPESDKILHHTKLLDPDTGEVLRFTAPAEPGTYPFVCTFPGHWVIMKGNMVVSENAGK